MPPWEPSSGNVNVPATGVDLAFESFGRREGVPLVLVMGLGTQMLAWPDEMCSALANRDMFVIRFDNRDTGLSTHFHGVQAPPPGVVLLRRAKPPYLIDDMADDTIGLLDGLGLESAHLVGASMGGFIAQTVTLKAPPRVRSLTLIMTSTGSRRVGRPQAKVIRHALRRPAAASREEAIDLAVRTLRLIGSPGYPFDESDVRDLARRSLERSNDPGGFFRQLAAVLAQPDRTRLLGQVRVPTTVIHGLSDPLVSPSGGKALARAIHGARFVGIPGMGHDLPRPVISQLEEEIAAAVHAGEEQARALR